jgi:putative transposase
LNAYANAVVEAFFATLECELIDRHVWRHRQEGERAIFDFIEVLSRSAPASLHARLPVAGRVRAEVRNRCSGVDGPPPDRA